MSVTREEVKKIAYLARLKFSDEQEETLTEEMNAILQYMDKLNELDTSHVEPLHHVIEMGTVFRDDAVAPSLLQDEALMNAPEKFECFFVVPKVLD